MRKALELLQSLTNAFPPDVGRPHSLELKDSKLTVVMLLGGKFYGYELDEDDLVQPLHILMMRLHVAHAAQKDAG